MNWSIKSHRFQNVSFKPSPNYNDRPNQDDISLIVIHNISLPPGEFENTCVEEFFCNNLDASSHDYFESIKDLKVSAHLFVKRSGEVIQFVDLNKRAWHAGVSSFNGRENCNDYSIGIEVEGTDTMPFTDKQYSSLQNLCLSLINHYPKISLDNITGHEHIAPGRKTDPGPYFNWPRLRELLKNSL